MIQLSYQPAFDVFHTAFRLLRLREILIDLRLPFDEYRILDFYLTFPNKLSQVRFKPEHRRFKAVASQYENTKPYGLQPDDNIIFDRMEPMQKAAMKNLMSRGFFEETDMMVEHVIIASQETPLEITNRIYEANKIDHALMNLLRTVAIDYPFIGPMGLKARTKLMDFRYDPV